LYGNEGWYTKEVLMAECTSSNFKNQAMRRSGKTLTPREQEVLAKLAKGFLYKEIAHHLSISIDTVKKHCKNIYSKLQVRNRTEAVNFYHRLKAA